MTRSKFEQIVITNLRKTKIKFKYESQKIPYVIKKNYIEDITLLSNGIIIEMKGWFRPSDRTKMLAVKESNPHLDIRFLFQYDNYISNKTKKTRYSDWCEKHGFKYHIGESIPREWILEKPQVSKGGDRDNKRSRTRGIKKT